VLSATVGWSAALGTRPARGLSSAVARVARPLLLSVGRCLRLLPRRCGVPHTSPADSNGSDGEAPDSNTDSNGSSGFHPDSNGSDGEGTGSVWLFTLRYLRLRAARRIVMADATTVVVNALRENRPLTSSLVSLLIRHRSTIISSLLLGSCLALRSGRCRP